MSFLFLSPKCPSMEVTNTPNINVHSHTCMQTHIHIELVEQIDKSMLKKYVILKKIHSDVIVVMIDHRKQCVKLACDSQRLVDKWGPGLEILPKSWLRILWRYLANLWAYNLKESMGLSIVYTEKEKGQNWERKVQRDDTQLYLN